MSNIDIMKRFLAARQNIDANAKALYQCLEYQRDDIDAVVLDMDNIASIKAILEASELSYYLLDIESRIDGEKQIILFSSIQTSKGRYFLDCRMN